MGDMSERVSVWVCRSVGREGGSVCGSVCGGVGVGVGEYVCVSVGV